MPAQMATDQPEATARKLDGPRRRLVVHLGFPKTGTTTIQGMLAANAARLGDGIAVSAKDDLTLHLRKTAFQYVRTGFKLWRWRHRSALVAMQERIDAMAFETLIISGENMVGFVSDKLFDRKIERKYVELAGKLDASLSAYEVTYIIYTREVSPWQVSAYNQAFKMRRGTKKSFADWKTTHDNLAGPDEIIASLRTVLGDRLHVVQMEDELGPGRLLGCSLLVHAGITSERIAGIIPPPRKNESLPASGMELLRLIHANPALRGWRYRIILRLIVDHPELFARANRQEGAGTSTD